LRNAILLPKSIFSNQAKCPFGSAFARGLLETNSSRDRKPLQSVSASAQQQSDPASSSAEARYADLLEEHVQLRTDFKFLLGKVAQATQVRAHLTHSPACFSATRSNY
jgi:hypothetical protein